MNYNEINENDLTINLSKEEWSLITIKLNLTENIIKEYKNYLDWNIIHDNPSALVLFGTSISSYKILKEKTESDYDEYYFIKDMLSMDEWTIISKSQFLTENFVKEFEHYIDWESIQDNPSSTILFETSPLSYALLEKYNTRTYNKLGERTN